MARSPASDPQREQVYAAENEICRVSIVTPDVLQQAATEVADMYGLPSTPQISIYPRHASDEYGCVHTDGRVWLNSSRRGGCGANFLVLMHEMAHVINDEYGAGEHHGPFWAGIYSYLLAAFKVLPLDATGVLFRRHGIRRRRPALCSPQSLRR